MRELINFKSIKIGLASPEKIREWSYGEVKKPETINYRTSKPEKDGLFCEKIFGPTKDWECYCGKYKQIRYKGTICDRCGVEITKSKVRRERMGHIELAAPVTHIWYLKGVPSRIGLLLDVSPRELEKVIYFAAYIITEPGNTPLEPRQILSEEEYRTEYERFGEEFTAKMGAEAIYDLLCGLDLEKLSKELQGEVKSYTGQKKIKAVRRLEIVEAFRKSGNRPQDMVLWAVPVIPPELRPMVMLDGGRFATSDLNDLYRRVINRNNRLQKLLELGAPDIIIQNEKRMLQEAVDALIDNGRRGRPVTGPGNRPLRSLSEMLKGKQGRFRQNLLGKRVDYSGRSVIVVGPELHMHQCGVPKEMAIELFKPFVTREIVNRKLSQNIKSAKRMVERQNPIVWDVLEDVIKGHPVLLNRAPTLHRLGIQAFEPILVDGRAIKLHPLVCSAYNADFDGDQMAIHVPLSVEAQAEARFLMLAAYNILKPQDGNPIVSLSQDMILGSYYLTIIRDDAAGAPKKVTDVSGNEYIKYSVYADLDEAKMAYANKLVELQTVIKIYVEKDLPVTLEDGSVQVRHFRRVVTNSLGRFIFNEIIPQDLGFIERFEIKETDSIEDREKAIMSQFALEFDKDADKGALSDIVYKCFLKHGPAKTSILADDIKANGFHYSTKAAITVGVMDMQVPEIKKVIISNAEKEVSKVYKQFSRALITDEERKKKTIDIWTRATNEVTSALLDNLDPKNPINMMAQSGARGSKNQIRQLAGMRGLMASPSGEIIELPIKSNFREGLDVLEFFISSHGARKGLADTALRTADSGYLTRRLVDVSQDQIIREEDCHTHEGYVVSAIKNGKDEIESLRERIIGRFACGDIVSPQTNEVLVKSDEIITIPDADKIVSCGIKEVKIRSVFTCESKVGICAKCYGMDLTTTKKINIGEAVGTIAAQSIGEPGTQLTMRTFHTGGVAGAADMTQGLPRVEELFESRKPKGVAIITMIDGVVSISVVDKNKVVQVAGDNEIVELYEIPYGAEVLVKEGQTVKAGDQLTRGSINPNELVIAKGIQGVQDYILHEVQKVYRLQGVHISDKHIEVIVRQMLRKVKVMDNGETDLITGALVDMVEFNEANRKASEAGKELAVGERELLGITKAALATSSFLSAASFQETTKVLTDAAIRGKVDPLVGLKENIILGKLIPAGTGISSYENIVLDKDLSSLEFLQVKDEKSDIISPEATEDDEALKEDDFSDFLLDKNFVHRSDETKIPDLEEQEDSSQIEE